MGALIGIDQSSDFRPLERVARFSPPFPPPLPSALFAPIFARQFRRGKYLIDSSVCNPAFVAINYACTASSFPLIRFIM